MIIATGRFTLVDEVQKIASKLKPAFKVLRRLLILSCRKYQKYQTIQLMLAIKCAMIKYLNVDFKNVADLQTLVLMRESIEKEKKTVRNYFVFKISLHLIATLDDPQRGSWIL